MTWRGHPYHIARQEHLGDVLDDLRDRGPALAMGLELAQPPVDPTG